MMTRPAHIRSMRTIIDRGTLTTSSSTPPYSLRAVGCIGKPHDLPLAQNKHVFWARDMHCTAPGLRSVAPNRYFQRMTLEQRAAVQCVHVFGALRWFDDTILPILRTLEVHPRSIKITHIHSNLYWTQERNSRGGPAKMVSTIPWARIELQEMTRLERLEIESEVMSQYEPLVGANQSPMTSASSHTYSWKRLPKL